MIRKFKNKDNFHPVKITAYIHIITTIPYLIMTSIDLNTISSYVTSHSSFTGYENTIFKYILIQSVAYICIIIGINNFTKLKLSKYKAYEILIGYKSSNSKLIKSYVLLFSIGILSYLLLIKSMGGINYILKNTYQRATLQSGKSLLMSLSSLTMMSVYCLIYSLKYNYNKRKVFYIIINIILVFIMFAVFGGRKTSIYFVLTCAIIWNYSVNKIKILNMKNILVIFILIIYFIATPLLRFPGAIEFYSKNPESFVNEIEENSVNFIKQISYVDHYLLIINNFSSENFWYGKTYLDLLMAPIPRSILKDKPPVDDGVYVRSIAEGMEVEPNTSYENLYQSSWPPETLGIAYMNFGILGVILFMIILGFVYYKSYRYMYNSKFNLFSIYIYVLVITNFHLSNLRIVQFLMDLLFNAIIFSIVLGVRIVRKS